MRSGLVSKYRQATARLTPSRTYANGAASYASFVISLRLHASSVPRPALADLQPPQVRTGEEELVLDKHFVPHKRVTNVDGKEKLIRLVRRSDAPIVPTPLRYGLASMARAGWGMEAFDYHYQKEYVLDCRKLNHRIYGTELEHLTLEEMVLVKEPIVSDLASQHFFRQFSPGASPYGATGEVENILVKQFGSIERLKEKFKREALRLHGSGYVWLAMDEADVFYIIVCENAQSLLHTGLRGLLVLDMWEHAYILDHGDNREAFIDKFWNAIDWSDLLRDL